MGNRGTSVAPCDLFRVTDGWVLVQIAGQPMFKRWCRLVDRLDLFDDPRFADDDLRWENGDVLNDLMQAWCDGRTKAEAMALLEAAKMPAAPLQSPQEVLEDPHVEAMGYLHRVPYPGASRPVPIIETPFRMSETPGHHPHAGARCSASTPTRSSARSATTPTGSPACGPAGWSEATGDGRAHHRGGAAAPQRRAPRAEGRDRHRRALAHPRRPRRREPAIGRPAGGGRRGEGLPGRAAWRRTASSGSSPPWRRCASVRCSCRSAPCCGRPSSSSSSAPPTSPTSWSSARSAAARTSTTSSRSLPAWWAMTAAGRRHPVAAGPPVGLAARRPARRRRPDGGGRRPRRAGAPGRRHGRAVHLRQPGRAEGHDPHPRQRAARGRLRARRPVPRRRRPPLHPDAVLLDRRLLHGPAVDRHRRRDAGDRGGARAGAHPRPARARAGHALPGLARPGGPPRRRPRRSPPPTSPTSGRAAWPRCCRPSCARRRGPGRTCSG